MVVTAVGFLRQIALAVIRPSELAAEDDDSVLEHATLFEVLDKGRRRLVRTVGIFLEVLW